MGIKKPLLRINDPRLFPLTIKEIKKRENLLDSMSSKIEVSECSGDIVINKEEDIELAINKAICEAQGKEKFNEVLVGIDTNSFRLTIAVVADGTLIDTKQTQIESVEDTIDSILESFPHNRFYIGVGTGNRLGELVYKVLSLKFPGVKRVDERKTSSKNPYVKIKNKDIRAAYLIALRSTT
ncbi:hypothetical protein [Acidianus brierleyi]|nr:hypothetical protein [Acidianus brierleyi]AWR94592.2 hypothetical protein DFR85_08295 [Acidianus brierleyi]